ncbi:MAG: VOC family protein [Microbacteriaceae bacterium]|nr:VOC family protein [Microbacteriaceae bacterium]
MARIASKLHPCLWFDGQALPAAEFYTGVFPDSSIDRITRFPSDATEGEPGAVLLVDFTLAGTRFVGLNGGSEFAFTEAVSFVITTEDQGETDRYWSALTAGGEESMCGWLRDRYGLSWQVTPRRLLDLVTSDDAEVARRAFQAMQPMRKIDIATIEAAVAGG